MMEEMILIEMTKGASLWILIVLVMLMVISAIAGFYLGMKDQK